MTHRRARRGLSLLEVLISAFILLFGLVGVAALLPVGKLYVEQADRYDRAAAVGHAAFHEIQTRGLLDPTTWCDAGGTVMSTNEFTWLVDPLGVAAGSAQFPQIGSVVVNRVSKLAGTPPAVMNAPLAQYIFQSRDDLATELPDDPDLPATQLVSGPIRGFDGQYSWMFMAQPMNDSDADGDPDTGGEQFRVSVIVFDGRIVEQSPALKSEYFFNVNDWPSGLGGGPAQLTDNASGAKDALESIDRGEWILLSNPTIDRYYWYRVVSADDVTGSSPYQRWVTLQGHDWVPTGGNPAPTQAAFADGVVAVYEKIMTRAK